MRDKALAAALSSGKTQLPNAAKGPFRLAQSDFRYPDPLAFQVPTKYPMLVEHTFGRKFSMIPETEPSKAQAADPSNIQRTPHWRELAEATALEQDPAKVIERAKDLIRALDAESDARRERSHPSKRDDNTAA